MEKENARRNECRRRVFYTYFSVHFGNGFQGFLRGCKANKSKTFGGTLFVTHDLCGGDGSEVSEFLAQLLVIDGFVKVLDEKVDALIFAHSFSFEFLEHGLEFLLTLGLLLCLADVKFETVHFLAVHLLDGFRGFLVCCVVDESKGLLFVVLAFVLLQFEVVRSDGAKFPEDLQELLLGHGLWHVLNKDIGPFWSFLCEFLVTLLCRDELGNKTFLSSQKFSVDGFNGFLGSFFGFKMNKSIAATVCRKKLSNPQKKKTLNKLTFQLSSRRQQLCN